MQARQHDISTILRSWNTRYLLKPKRKALNYMVFDRSAKITSSRSIVLAKRNYTYYILQQIEFAIDKSRRFMTYNEKNIIPFLYTFSNKISKRFAINSLYEVASSDDIWHNILLKIDDIFKQMLLEAMLQSACLIKVLHAFLDTSLYILYAEKVGSWNITRF